MEKRNLRKERVGVVTSNKMDKSIVISETKRVKHPMYGKFVLKTKKYVAHDETNDCNIGDTVKFTSIAPYRIKISGRTKHFINVFGEEVIIENSDNAIKNLCKKKNLEVVEYTVAPVFMDGKEKGRHQWLIEFKKPPSNMQEISSLIDELLKSENSDYEAKRYNNISLEKPEIIIGKKGVFYKWMKKRKKLGGQNKIPRLSNSREYIEELLKLNT